MKTIKLSLCIFALLSGFLTIAQSDTDYTLPNGRVLKNAYVMEKKPNGVVVGHSTGVMFVKYSKMPDELKKKLGYNAKKCAAYEKKARKYKKAQRKRKAKEKAEEAKRHKEIQNRIEKYKIVELKDKIRTTELRIERLKKEIPKLEAESKTFLNDAVKLSSVTTSSGSHGNYWRGGFWGGSYGSNARYNASKREVKGRYKAISAIGEEYSSAKFRLKNYKDEIDRKTIELEKMKRRLKILENKQDKKDGGFFSKLFG